MDGSHFGRPWYQRHGSGRMCHVPGCGGRPRLPGAGAGEAWHSRSAAETDIPRASGNRPQVLTLIGRARFIPFLGGCRRGLRHFWECRRCLGYGPAPRPTLKKTLCHTRPFGGACDKYRWFNKLINIRTNLTSFGYTAFWLSSISCKFSC